MAPGLLLIVKGGGASWILRYQLGGRRRDMGLGPVRLLGLARARELANARRVEIRVERRDPLTERQAERRGMHKRGVLFKTAMEDFLDANKARWKDPRAVDTWRNSLTTHAGALMGEDPRAVMKAFYRAKKMAAAKTRDLEELVDWMGRTYDAHYPKTVDDVARRPHRPRKK
jgi:Arm domain-containing DNA-binding protein